MAKLFITILYVWFILFGNQTMFPKIAEIREK